MGPAGDMRRGMGVRMRSSALALAVLGFLAFGSTAKATPFTLVESVPFNSGGVTGSIDPITDFDISTGAAFGNLALTSGTVNVDFVGQDVFLFQVTMAGGSLNLTQITSTVATTVNFATNPVGAGAFDDAGLQRPSGVSHAAAPFFRGVFDFDTAPNLLSASETTVRLFVTYAPDGGLNFFDNVSFMIAPGLFDVQGEIIPEPGTAILLGGGLLALIGVARTLERRNNG